MAIDTMILAISLIIIMFGMGLSLTKHDFTNLFKQPKAIFVGLFNQIVLLPIIAFVLVCLMDVHTDIAIGLMILAACPGGPTSNLITYLAKGDAGLSISLTVLNSIITIFTIPFIIDFALSHFLMENELVVIDKFRTILQIFVIIVIPVSIGMFIKEFRPNFANKMSKPVKIASALVLLLVLAVLIYKKQEDIIPYLKLAGITSLLLNIISMLLGLGTALFAQLKLKQSLTIAIESGIQNGTLAITIASGILLNDNYAIAPAVYSIIMFVTGALIITFAIKFVKSDDANTSNL